MDTTLGHHDPDVRQMIEVWRILRTQVTRLNRTVSIPIIWFDTWSTVGKDTLKLIMG